MRIKYKAPGQWFFRRFWRVSTYTEREGGGVDRAENKRGKKLFLPAGMITIVVP